MSTYQELGGTEVPSHRACANCRSQKVRCVLDDESSEVCQRCARADRTCVFTPLQKRRQRKRTDTRVSELEREMKAMRAALQAKERSGSRNTQNTAAPPSPRPEGLWFEKNSLRAPTRSVGYERSSVGQASLSRDGSRPGVDNARQQGGPTLWPNRFMNQPRDDSKDVVDSGLISMATARQLFETYRRDLCSIYPIVVIPESTTADELRKTRPALFLAIIAAAAGKDNADLSARLDKEVLHIYAERHVVQSEKSLELVEALLISAVWYHPPTKFGQLKYYEYIHMAATMALDIGIGTRPVPHRNLFGSKPSRQGRNLHPIEDPKNPDLSMTPRSRDSSPDTASLECRRTFLACYIVCSSVSMSLRRPNMLRVSSYVRDCLDFIEQSSEAAPSDRSLAAWVRLNIIAEDICSSFSYDDPGDIASITDLRTQFMLKDFEKRLSDWFSSTPDTDLSPGITIMYYSIRLYLHEIALHVDHSPEDFKAPYQMGPVHQTAEDEPPVPSKIFAIAVADCVSSAHSLMNAFSNIPPEQTYFMVIKGRGFPVFLYVRISYAAFVLAKLCLSAAHPESQIARVLDRSSLKVEQFMDKAILQVRAIVGTSTRRVPAIFLALVLKLRQWSMNPHMLDGPENAGDRAALDISQTPTMSPGGVSRWQATKTNTASRISEQPSSEESSPDDHIEQYDSITTFAAKTTAELDPNMSSELTPDSNDNSDMQRSSAAAISVPADLVPSTDDLMVNDIPCQPGSYLDPNDQMELDRNFFQMYGDMDALSNGGLTGLEDWSMLPTDMMGLPDIDWQMTATDAPPPF